MSQRIIVENDDVETVRRVVNPGDEESPTWDESLDVFIDMLRGLGYMISEEKKDKIMDAAND